MVLASCACNCALIDGAVVIVAVVDTVDEAVEGAKRRCADAWESCKRLFRFLSGEPVPSTRAAPPPLPEQKEEEKSKSKKSNRMNLLQRLNRL